MLIVAVVAVVTGFVLNAKQVEPGRGEEDEEERNEDHEGPWRGISFAHPSSRTELEFAHPLRSHVATWPCHAWEHTLPQYEACLLLCCCCVFFSSLCAASWQAGSQPANQPNPAHTHSSVASCDCYSCDPLALFADGSLMQTANSQQHSYCVRLPLVPPLLLLALQKCAIGLYKRQSLAQTGNPPIRNATINGSDTLAFHPLPPPSHSCVPGGKETTVQQLRTLTLYKDENTQTPVLPPMHWRTRNPACFVWITMHEETRK